MVQNYGHLLLLQHHRDGYNAVMRSAIPGLIIVAGVMTACAATPTNTSFASYGVSTQQEAAALVTTWRNQARMHWQQAEMLELEARLLSDTATVPDRYAIARKRQLAMELRASGGRLAERATELQRLLSVKMIQ